MFWKPTESNESFTIQKQNLPIYKQKSQLLYLIDQYQICIVVGATGSGKTSQIPQYLLENNHSIVCTQPRVLQCISVAKRVSLELNCTLGTSVGYSVLFQEKISRFTKIKYMTDEALFHEMLLDPLLSNYSVVMIDEAHERSIYTDILASLLKKVLKKRPDLRLVVSSATMDAERIYEFFNDTGSCVIFNITGRLYPVDVFYLKNPTENYLQEAIDAVFHIHTFDRQGDILVFLADKNQVDNAVEIINSRAQDSRIQPIHALPLHSSLDYQDQLACFESAPLNTRKVVVATNIAEASVTIENIVYVIDSGFTRIKSFDPLNNMERMVITKTSQAAAIQRAGRAGRTRPGKVFRLYTEAAFHDLPEMDIPEIQRSNLAHVIIRLKAIGIENVATFDYLSAPPIEIFKKALELVYSLNCIDDYARLTRPFGYALAEFPVEPMISTMLLNSGKYKCSEEALTIAAMLMIENVFLCPRGKRAEALEAKKNFSVEEGDHISYINVYDAFIKSQKSGKFCRIHYLDFSGLKKAVSIRKYLEIYLVKAGIRLESCKSDVDKLRKCITTGFFSHAAKLNPNGTYSTVLNPEELTIDATSTLCKRSPPWIIFHEIRQGDKLYMKSVVCIEPEWLTEIAPHFYSIK